MGWLYVCRQDRLLAHLDSMTIETEPIVIPDESNYNDVMARLATSLHMSSHIIDQIRVGAYSPTEIDKLITQKEHVLAVIRKAENAVEDTPPSLAAVRKSHDPTANIIASVGATPPASTTARTSVRNNIPRSTHSASSANTSQNDKHKGTTVKTDQCNYMVCHHCRPFVSDRLPITVESIVKGEQPAITEEEIMSLPMHHPATVRNLGLRPSPARRPHFLGLGFGMSESADLTMLQRDGVADGATPDGYSPSDTSSSLYDDEEDEDYEEYDPHPCPGPGVCPVYSRNSGCAYDGDFDDGHRAANHGYRLEHEFDNTAAAAEHITPDRARVRLRRVEGSVADTPGRTSSSGSSLSLPTPTTMPLTPVTPTDEHFEDVLSSRLYKPGKAATVCGVRSANMAFGGLRGKNSHSSLGSELEVAGGVALTEEAVETGLPDIVTQA
jgi:hypothetical protein